MKSLILAALAVAPAIALAPAAGATPADYLGNLEQFGFELDSDYDRLGMLAVGLGVCVNIFSGSTSMGEVAELRSMGIDPAASAALVREALGNLCPLASEGQLS